MKHKKSTLIFFALILVLASIFTACSDDTSTTTTASNTSGLVPVTNEEGETVTMILIDENGNEKVHIVMQPADSSGSPDETQIVETPTEGRTDANGNDVTLPGNPIDTENDDPKLKAINTIINAFNNGSYRFKGTMPSEEGENNTAEMVICDGNMSAIMAFEGISIDVRILDGKMYMLNPATKKYCEVSESSMKTLGMDMEGFNVDELTKAMSSDKIHAAGDPDISTEKIDGKTLTKYDYPREDGSRKIFYLDSSNKLVRMDNVPTGNGKAESYYFESFDTNVTLDDVKIPSDYKKQTMLTFMASLATSLLDN